MNSANSLKSPYQTATSSDSQYQKNNNLTTQNMLTYKFSESKESFDRNWEEIYVEACKRYNVVPASYFQRNMRKENLIMRHHGLGAKGAQAIAVALVVSITT